MSKKKIRKLEKELEELKKESRIKLIAEILIGIATMLTAIANLIQALK